MSAQQALPRPSRAYESAAAARASPQAQAGEYARDKDCIVLHCTGLHESDVVILSARKMQGAHRGGLRQVSIIDMLVHVPPPAAFAVVELYLAGGVLHVHCSRRPPRGGAAEKLLASRPPLPRRTTRRPSLPSCTRSPNDTALMSGCSTVACRAPGLVGRLPRQRCARAPRVCECLASDQTICGNNPSLAQLLASSRCAFSWAWRAHKRCS